MNFSGSVKCWEVLEWLHNWRLLKNGSAPGVSEYTARRKKLSLAMAVLQFSFEKVIDGTQNARGWESLVQGADYLYVNCCRRTAVLEIGITSGV
jgi:hypothetical protein